MREKEKQKEFKTQELKVLLLREYCPRPFHTCPSIVG